MIVRIVGKDRVHVDQEMAGLRADLETLGPAQIAVSDAPAPRRAGLDKGDPVTIGAIIVALMGAGGALGKDGALTVLARLLYERLTRKVDIEIESDGQIVKLSGNVQDIEKALRISLKRDNAT